MMNLHAYAKTLMQVKGHELSLLKFLGARWLALKVFLVIVGIVGLVQPYITTKFVGVFALGYVFGVVVADIRSYVVAKRRWSLQQQLYDWHMIEALSKEESDSVDKQALPK